MTSATRLEIELLAGARELLLAHAQELPQRDDLCGAFCGALALRAAGAEAADGEPLDQDAVARAAGSVVSAVADRGHLPAGEPGRRDYRLPPPSIDDERLSGTTAAGLVGAIEQLSEGDLVAIPYAGRWSASSLAGLFDLIAGLERPVTLIANVATAELWGSGSSAGELLAYLLGGEPEAPARDWEVGHFVCVIGRVRGPSGSLYVVADTYPSLGHRGVHLQPEPRMALALERPGMATGGLVVVVAIADAASVRAGAASLGLTEGAWDNGTAPQATPR